MSLINDKEYIDLLKTRLTTAENKLASLYPVIDKISPNTISEGPFVLKIDGQNFGTSKEDLHVTVGDQDCTIIGDVNDSHIEVMVPALVEYGYTDLSVSVNRKFFATTKIHFGDHRLDGFTELQRQFVYKHLNNLNKAMFNLDAMIPQKMFPMRGRYPHLCELSDHVFVISSEGDDLDVFNIETGEAIAKRNSGGKTLTAMTALSGKRIAFATKNLMDLTNAYKLSVYDDEQKLLVIEESIDYLADRIIGFENFIVALNRQKGIVFIYQIFNKSLNVVTQFDIVEGATDIELLTNGIAVSAGETIYIYDMKGDVIDTVQAGKGCLITAIELLSEKNIACLIHFSHSDAEPIICVFDILDRCVTKTIPVDVPLSSRMVAITPSKVATYHAERYSSDTTIYDVNKGKVKQWPDGGAIRRVGRNLLVADIKQKAVVVYGC